MSENQQKLRESFTEMINLMDQAPNPALLEWSAGVARKMIVEGRRDHGVLALSAETVVELEKLEAKVKEVLG